MGKEMWEGIYEGPIEEAKQRVVQLCSSNPVLASLGFCQTDEVLVQVLDDVVVLRGKSCLDDSLAPALVLKLHPRGEKTAVTASMKDSPKGLQQLRLSLGATIFLVIISLICIAVRPMDSLAWGESLFAGLFAVYLWSKAVSLRNRSKSASMKFVNDWMNTSPKSVANKGMYEVSTVKTEAATLPAVPDALGKHSSCLFVGCEADEIVTIANRRKNDLPATKISRGTTTPQFDTRAAADEIRIRRIRPSNLFGIGPVNNLLDIDFAPRLKVRVRPEQDGKTQLEVFSSTTLMRKLWTIFAYTIVLPFGAAGLLSLLLLILPVITLPQYLPAFTCLYMCLIGTFWIEREMSAVDQFELLLLMAELGEIVPGQNVKTIAKDESASGPVIF